MSRLVAAGATVAVLLACGVGTATGEADGRASGTIVHVDIASGAAGRNYELFRTTLSGHRTRLTRNRAREWAPRWSPDGRRIVFERWFSDDTSGWGTIWVANADGSRQRQIVGGKQAPGAHVNAPRWSPNGRWIAFELPRSFGSRGPTNGPTDIWLIRPDGTGLRQLLDAKTVNFLWSDAAGPQWDWAPDSRRIVYTTPGVLGGGTASRLVIVDVATGVERELVDGEEPRWSRRGIMAFRRSDGLYVIRPDGSGLRRLVAARGVREPSWSYDGTRLAYEQNQTHQRETARVAVIAADGSRRRSVAAGSETGRIIWSRDGRHLLFRGRRGVAIVSVLTGQQAPLDVGPEYDWRG